MRERPAGSPSPAASPTTADPAGRLAALAGVAADRARLGERELGLIDQARRDGATWAQIAVALGLASRQAAEQRRHRLATAVDRDLRQRIRAQDERHGRPIAALRAAVAELAGRIGADPRWDDRFARAALVRATVAAAVPAEPGGLFALAATAVTDLAAVRPQALPPDIRSATTALRRALHTAVNV